jgi:hypothetical protein
MRFLVSLALLLTLTTATGALMSRSRPGYESGHVPGDEAGTSESVVRLSTGWLTDDREDDKRIAAAIMGDRLRSVRIHETTVIARAAPGLSRVMADTLVPGLLQWGQGRDRRVDGVMILDVDGSTLFTYGEPVRATE